MGVNLGYHFRFDLIVFAQPYFSGKPIKEFEFTRGMLDSQNLQERFFKEALLYLSPKGRIALMGWKFAGEKNDPALIAPKFGLKVESIDSYHDWTGVQRGEFHIVLLG